MSNDLLILFIGAGVFVTLAMIINLLASDGTDQRGKRRLSALRERHSSSHEVQAQAQMRRILAARETKLDTALSGFLPNRVAIKQRLQRTGKSWGVGHYVLANISIMGLTLAALASAGAPLLLALAVGIFFGLSMPHSVVGFLIKKRLNSFNSRFPDAIDLLTRGLRSGLPIGESVNVVGTEVGGVVGDEFRRVSDKVRIGRSMDEALQETADRIGTPEFQFFVITLNIQRETGGNLAETLSNLADVLRKRQQMKLKIKAMSSESKASAYIVGSLPFIVFALIYSIDPGYMGTFFTDTRLMIAGIGGMIWMSIGAAIMAKMVSFEI